MAEENINIFTSHDMPNRSFKYFEEIRNKQELCDFTIQVGNESISAHRIVVTAAIPYFRDVLSSKSEKPDEESIVLPDIEPSALKCLIEFAYSCKVSIREQNVRSLLSASCQLHVEEVRDACLDFLWNKLEPEDAISVREFVSKLNCSDFSTKIDCYVRKNFDKVSRTKDFQKCAFSYLRELIEKDDLKVIEEENVLQSVMNWVKASPGDRKVHLPDLLRNVRLGFLKPLYFIDIVKNEELLRTSHACRNLIVEARNYISFPETRKGMCSFKTQPRKSMVTARVEEEKGSISIWKLHSQLKVAIQHFSVVDRKWITTEFKFFFLNDGSAVEMDKKIYFFRWGDTLQYNPTNDEYKFLTDVPTPRICSGSSCLKNTIYVCGGRVGRVASNVVECFNPGMNKWSKISSMPKSLWGASVVTFGGHIFVFGGQDDCFMYNSVERYDPTIDSWEYMPSMNVKRSFAGAAVLNGQIYVCGGNTSVSTTTAIATSEVYNPITRSWKSIRNMNTPRCLFTLLPFTEKLYAIGGKHEAKSVDFFEVYDTKSNKWTAGPSTVLS